VLPDNNTDGKRVDEHRRARPDRLKMVAAAGKSRQPINQSINPNKKKEPCKEGLSPPPPVREKEAKRRRQDEKNEIASLSGCPTIAAPASATHQKINPGS